jgi:hypothetical protein
VQTAPPTIGRRSSTSTRSPAHHALAAAIVTDRCAIPPAKREQVDLLVGKYLV